MGSRRVKKKPEDFHGSSQIWGYSSKIIKKRDCAQGSVKQIHSALLEKPFRGFLGCVVGFLGEIQLPGDSKLVFHKGKLLTKAIIAQGHEHLSVFGELGKKALQLRCISTVHIEGDGRAKVPGMHRRAVTTHQ